MLTVLVLGGDPMENAALRELVSGAERIRATDEQSLATNVNGAGPQRPDVVLLTVDRDDGTADTIIQATLKWKPTPLLVVTNDFDRQQRLQFVCAGVHGIIDKDHGSVDLIKAIRKVAQGELWLDRLSVALLIDAFAQLSRQRHSIANGTPLVTPREREVMALVAQGFSNKRIGMALNISDSTVRHHLTAIFAKLGVDDRLNLACYAMHEDRRLVRDARLGGVD